MTIITTVIILSSSHADGPITRNDKTVRLYIICERVGDIIFYFRERPDVPRRVRERSSRRATTAATVADLEPDQFTGAGGGGGVGNNKWASGKCTV